MTTAFFDTSPTPRQGSAICTMLTPAMSAFSGWTHGSCSRAARRIRSPAPQRSRASEGSSAKPSAAASAIAYHMPPKATSTVSVPSRTQLSPALGELRVTIHDQVAEGDKVTTRKTVSGTHVGTLLGMEATWRAVAIDVIDIVRIADGRYAEHWGLNTLSAVLAQLKS